MEATKSWIQEVYEVLQQEAQQQGVQFPTPELKKLVTEVEFDFAAIYQDLIYDGIIPAAESIREVLRSPTVFNVIDAYYVALSGLTEMQRGLQRCLHQELMMWHEDINYVKEGK